MVSLNAVRIFGGVVVSLLLVTQAVAKTEAVPVDFSGYWELGVDFREVIKPDDDKENLTDEAKRRLEEFHKAFPEKKAKWPSDFCLMPGMPGTMLSRARTYATEIVQTPTRIFVIGEVMDTFRHIRLDQKSIPEDVGHSNQGYSIARWEGNELVIETGALIARNDFSDIQRSDEARILERWRMVKGDQGQDLLEVELWVTDPVIYKKPAYGRKRFRRMPEGTQISGYNCANALWDDHVEEVLRKKSSAGGGR